MRKCNSLQGFSFVELIMVMGMLIIISSFAIPYSLNIVSRRNVQDATEDIASNLWRQQQNAYSGNENKNYGISFTENGYTIFKWEDGNPNETQADITLETGITITNITFDDLSSEITFGEGEILPSTFGSLDVTDGGNTFQVTINAQGLIDYSLL
ncbi:prepilin-type N-terminal cleavage/methylation domain-containing protein [Candidatus Dojkabacteria bacterium]|uniref:Prepilin-type N-terminal cleavage/methylation domain-containing protein n=1 Tax=Candidatus Dojkabacteria bacterium TaxID=2099670 RepID=A0A955L7J1_9BACT|nr:prepilin-type N-terminal cleavage/methylation domain-containing protein [Candidatus Dojkabacteria bacterium]